MRGGMWRSTDFASPMPSWTSLTDGRADLQVVPSIVVDQADSRTVYVVSRSTFFRSCDVGVTFPDSWMLPAGVPESEFAKIFQHPTTGEIYGATELVGLHRLTAAGLVTVGANWPNGIGIVDIDVIIDAAGVTTCYAIVRNSNKASVSGFR
jgi:hypothetical protein